MGKLITMRSQVNELIEYLNVVELKETHSSSHLLTKITHLVASYYMGVTFEDLISGKRLKEPSSSAKHTAIYLCTQQGIGSHEVKTFFNLAAYQSIYHAVDNVVAALEGKARVSKLTQIQHIKKIDIETLTQYINDNYKQPHTT